MVHPGTEAPEAKNCPKCNATVDVSTAVIQCDDCGQWFHQMCANVTIPEGVDEVAWSCDDCMDDVEEDTDSHHGDDNSVLTVSSSPETTATSTATSSVGSGASMVNTTSSSTTNPQSQTATTQQSAVDVDIELKLLTEILELKERQLQLIQMKKNRGGPPLVPVAASSPIPVLPPSRKVRGRPSAVPTPPSTIPGSQHSCTMPGSQPPSTISGSQPSHTMPGSQPSHTMPGSQRPFTMSGSQPSSTTPSTSNNQPTFTQLNTGTAPTYAINQPIAHVDSRQTLTQQSSSFSDSVVVERMLRVMSRQYLIELPAFSGNPEEFPAWIAAYNSTTRDGDYGDADNLLRLQKSLKGDARTLVQARLYNPASVPAIIQDLTAEYGNPRTIINKVKSSLNRSPTISENNPIQMKEFFHLVRNAVGTLESIGDTSYINTPLLVDELEQKFSDSLKRQWRTHINKVLQPQGVVNYGLRDLMAWLKTITDWITTEDIERSKNKQPKTQGHRVHYQGSEKPPEKPTHFKCEFCRRDSHKTDDCQRFRKRPLEEKRQFVKAKSLCFICLGFGHRAAKCPEEGRRCGFGDCEEGHHISLHWEPEHLSRPIKKGKADLVPKDSKPEKVTTVKHVDETTVVYRIAPVKLTHNGKTIEVNAFIDDGSAVTLLSQDIAKQLGVRGTPEVLFIEWTDNTVRRDDTSERVHLQISGCQTNAKQYTIRDVRTTQTLNLPPPEIDPAIAQKKFPHLAGIPFPPYSSSRPQILIGLGHALLTVSFEARVNGWNDPIATRTKIGWVLHGKIKQSSLRVPRVCVTCDVRNDQKLHDLVNQFFSLEAAGMQKTSSELQSKETERALHVLQTKTIKKGDRFETGLLWKRDDIALPDNYNTAFRRLVCLENRIKSDPALKEAVTSKIKENLDKGYARLLSPAEARQKTPKTWYLPIFPVTNPHKPGKIRIVYDAAAKTKGVCLNDFLLTGPDLLTSLTSVLSKHREYAFAVTGDIREMFHRVLINQEDQQAQRFLWRDSPDKRPDVYVMCVMTFGATCSPTTSQFVKNHNAKQFIEEHPRAVEAIVNRHYMDDLLDSFPTEEAALQTVQEVIRIHAKAGMELRGFKSNSPRIMQELNDEPVMETEVTFNDQSDINKVLGMAWNIVDDTYIFQLRFVKIDPELIDMKRTPTKREVLRIVMSIFDPLGLVANVVVYAKILLKEIWTRGVGWDQQLFADLHNSWKAWFTELKVLSSVRIPRCYSPLIPESNDIQLHIFVDASKDAFAAVGYLRVAHQEKLDVALMRAKTRVSPKRQQTIPRLELQAAVLGVRLARLIQKEHSVPLHHVQYWSDSQTVLKWIRSENRKFNQFVAFRVSQILEESEVGQWRWVPGKLNVADDGTKWNGPPDMSTTGRWFGGPNFLKEKPGDWPQENVEPIPALLEEEIAAVNLQAVANPPFAVIDARRFSKWSKLVRSVSWVLRFIRNARLKNVDKHRKKLGSQISDVIQKLPDLEANELEEAESLILRKAQWEDYHDEIWQLEAQLPVEKSSKIYKLSPTLDAKGFLRLRGRIDAVPLMSDEFKRPLILNRHNPITHLILFAYHCKFKHQGSETVVNEVRQRFWIPDIRVAVKKVKNSCQTCRVNSAKPLVPEMAPLPTDRVTPYEPPFTHVGIDFFGPIEVAVKRSREKRWGVVFTCLGIRAVHLDIVNKMDASSCIMAIRNFICRWGTPKIIRCDRGTNLRGAETELRKALVEIDFNRVTRETQTLLPGQPPIQWRFNPAAAPHMGGVWERLVRSVKNVLYKMLNTKAPREDTLRSFLAEAQDIVNSRPLTYRTQDPEEQEAITPNHLLRLSGAVNLPPSINNQDDCSKQWRIAQGLADQFWARWLNEYLPEITRRSKWYETPRELVVGDIVFVVDPAAPRNSWSRGRVIEIFPGADGHVRSARVLTKNATLLRPVAKLAVIDVEHHGEKVTQHELQAVGNVAEATH